MTTLLDDLAGIVPVEIALLGAVLAWPGDATVPPLLPQEFSLEGHRVIWAVMLDLEAAGERPTLVAVGHELDRTGRLAEAGGPAKLAQCFVEAHVPVYVPSLARQIRQAARQRAMRQLGMQLTSQGLSPEDVEARLAEMPGPLAPNLFDPAENWRSIIAEWDRPALKTRLAAVDRLLGGFRRGQIAVVGGRTSHGKTTFAAHLALRFAEAGRSVEFVSLEETEDDLVSRLAANVSGVRKDRIDQGLLDDVEFARVETAVRRVQALPIQVRALSSLRSLEESSVVGAVMTSTADVVLVDHLNKILTSDDSRTYGLERVLNRLHAAALRRDAVVIVMAQLSREMDVQKRVPMLHDLRDTGAAEQTARRVLLLYWPAKHRQADPGDYEIHVAKNVGGGSGVAHVRFDATTGRFSDRDEDQT